MGWKINIFILAVAVLVALYWSGSFDNNDQPPPEIKDGWWGEGEKVIPDDEKIYPYKINVPDDVLVDLKRRLESARLPVSMAGTNFHYGMNTKYLQDVISYWKEGFDWRKTEAYLNTFSHHKTQIEGIDVHFIHAKPMKKTGKKRVVLIIHGWPGSVFEFHKIIPMLTNPAKYGGKDDDAVEIVAPSIPGFGFSEASHKTGFNVIAAAGMFKKLMLRLGHSEFYIQGGDWGSAITTSMAQLYPQNVIGIHLNMIPEPMSMKVFMKKLIGSVIPSLVWEPEDIPKIYPMSKMFYFILQESGYFHIQATKPDTVGVGLNDSPAGLAAYILEKFSTWTNNTFKDLNDGGLDQHFTKDELLTNVMIYWVTGTITSSMRFYKEYFSPIVYEVDSLPVKVPASLASFPNELGLVPKSIAEEKFWDIVQYTEMPSGGHFAALEQPELLAKDILSFLKKVEERVNKRIKV